MAVERVFPDSCTDAPPPPPPPPPFGREKLCEKLMEASGATFLHPYNDPRVMAGQGTIALELLEQVWMESYHFILYPNDLFP